jgi:hypothetical protein
MSTHAMSVQTLDRLLTRSGQLCTVLGQSLYKEFLK